MAGSVPDLSDWVRIIGKKEQRDFFKNMLKIVDKCLFDCYNRKSVVNWSTKVGGGIECLFVQKINLQRQEEIREEQTGKCLHQIW